MFHWDRLPVLSKSIELFFPFQKEKKKRNAFSLNCRLNNFHRNEDYPKIGKEFLSDFENIKTQLSTFTYSF